MKQLRDQHIPKLLLLALAGVIFSRCSSGKIMYDYDRSADFTTYKTFNFHPNMNLDKYKDFDDQRILYKIEQCLLEKGLHKSDYPDMYVNVYPKIWRGKKQTASVGLGFGGGTGNVGIDVGGTIPIYKEMEDTQLTVDIVDASNSQLKWQGYGAFSSAVFSDSQKREDKIEKGIDDMMMNYPPKNR